MKEPKIIQLNRQLSKLKQKYAKDAMKVAVKVFGKQARKHLYREAILLSVLNIDYEVSLEQRMAEYPF